MASLSTLETTLKDISASSFTNEAERSQAKDLLLEALRRVQSPWDNVWEHCWTSCATNAAVKILIDVGVFKVWSDAGGGEKTSNELANLAGVDGILVGRLLRHLAAEHLVSETGHDTYAPTPFSRTLAESKWASIYGPLLHELDAPHFANLPYHLATTGYKNPTDATNCNHQAVYGAASSQFAWVGSSPALTTSFNNAMEIHGQYNLTPWTDVYPTESIVAAQKPGRTLVVDVGGGKGHDLEKFLSRHPTAPTGSLILQDLPEILADVKLASEACVVQPHDFFTPQPVKGATCYFMHTVLHDWPDDTAVSIMQNIAGSMEKGYSKLLIHEFLVSDVKPSLGVTGLDLTMMAMFAAKERTETEWRSLVEKAGLRVVRVYASGRADSVLEAELV